MALPFAVLDRRRSRRRHLREPTELTLRNADDAYAWSCKAAMLNLSTDGIACRVRAADGEAITIGQTLRATFRVGAKSQEFDLACRVKTNTPAGTPEHAVIGMEFVPDDNLGTARERLRVAINSACSGGKEVIGS